MTGAAVNRVPMRVPGPGYVVHVAEEHVEALLEHGWEVAQRRRSQHTDTGATPTQRSREDGYQNR